MSTSESGHSSGTVLEQVGDNIIHHVSNSSLDHPLIHLPTFFGIDISVTKHVLMLWVVAALVSIFVIVPIQKYMKKEKPVPSGWMNAIEAIVSFIRDAIVKPNIGSKFTDTWAPMILTFFFFILFANGIGLIPIFDTLGATSRFLFEVPKGDDHYFVNKLLHGGATVTGNFNVTAGLAALTFFAIIIAGSKAHGFIAHWKNLKPKGFSIPISIMLILIETLGMFVKPFALTMRLAANMTGGHIALLAILSFMAIFSEMVNPLTGIGLSLFAVPMAAAISGLEIIVVLVQAYVFTLLSAVFIGMAINVHH
jgi:F-type H+-transporting ATPase subunit a